MSFRDPRCHLFAVGERERHACDEQEEREYRVMVMETVP